MKIVEAFGWFWKFVFLKPGHNPAESEVTSGRLKPNTCANGNVELAPTNTPAFQLIDEDMLDDIGDRKKLRILEPGDKVIFKWK